MRFKGYTSENDMWLPSSAFKEPVTLHTVSKMGRLKKHRMKEGSSALDAPRSSQTETPTNKSSLKRKYDKGTNEGILFDLFFFLI